MTKQGELVCVQCMNYFSNELKYKNNVLVSSSGDSVLHGFGIISINQIAEKYHGHMVISPKENIFTISVLFNPNQSEKKAV